MFAETCEPYVKPENLLLDKAGRVKIADFGIAKMFGAEGADEERPESHVAGTPKYMSPEQRTKPCSADHRADIYSLGVVLYEMLTGELPEARLQPPSRKMALDVRLDEIVMRALESSPELRWQTAAEFRTQVETLVLSKREGGRREALPQARGNAVARVFRRMPPELRVAAALVVALLGIGIGAHFLTQSRVAPAAIMRDQSEALRAEQAGRRAETQRAEEALEKIAVLQRQRVDPAEGDRLPLEAPGGKEMEKTSPATTPRAAPAIPRGKAGKISSRRCPCGAWAGRAAAACCRAGVETRDGVAGPEIPRMRGLRKGGGGRRIGAR